MFNFFNRNKAVETLQRSVSALGQECLENRVQNLERQLNALCDYLKIYIQRPSAGWKVEEKKLCGAITPMGEGLKAK